MSIPLSYRAELANQVLASLRQLPADAWVRAREIRDERPHQHVMILGLAEHAVDLLAEEFGPDLVAVVRAHLNDVDLVASPVTDPRHPIVRGAVLASFLRDSAGFSVAAFNELFRPVAPFVDLQDAERIARGAVIASDGRKDATIEDAVPLRKRA